MLSTMHIYSKVGCIGSHIIENERRISCTGGVVWNDGSMQLIGGWVGELPPHLSYMRPIDYSLPSALLLRRTALNEVRPFKNHVDISHTISYYDFVDWWV